MLLLLLLLLLALAGAALGAVGLLLVHRGQSANLGWTLTALGCGGALLAGLAVVALVLIFAV